MRKFKTLFSFIVLLLSIARVSFAMDLASQDVYSSEANNSATAYVQTLGSGLSGSFSYVDFYGNNGCTLFDYCGDEFVTSVEVNLYSCNSDYSDCTEVVSSSPVTGIGDDKSLYSAFFTEPVVFDPAVYYALQFYTLGQNAKLAHLSGSTSDLYSGGTCWNSDNGTIDITVSNNRCTNLDDLFFVIRDGGTCFDGLLNQNETSLDWGGVCDTLSYFSDMNPSHQVSVTADIVDGSDSMTVFSSSGILEGMIVSSFGVPFNTYVGSVANNVVSLVDVNDDPVLATETGVVAVDFVDVIDPAVGLFDVTVNIDESEYESGMTVCMYFENDGVTLSGEFFLARWASVASDQCFDLTQSGANVISSAGIDFEDFSGLSTVTYEVFKPTWISSVPVLGWFFDDKSFLRTEIRFALTELSQLDIARVEDNLGATLLANVGLTEISACKIATFSFGKCIQGLFIPEKADLLNSWCSFQVGREYVAGSGCTGTNTLFGGVLNVWPLGYITRFLDLIVYAEPVMPPALSYTFGSAVDGTGLTGETIEYQIYEHFDVLESIESDQGTSSNLWDIVMPYFTVVVNLALFVAIFVKLIAYDWTFDVSSSSSSRSVSSPSRKPDSKSVQDVKNKFPQLRNYE